jgi:hypothetical protein
MTISRQFNYQGDAEGLRKALIKIVTERHDLVPRNQDATRVHQAQCNGERNAYEQVLRILNELKVTK